MVEVGKTSVIRLQIGENEQGQRLDNFLFRTCKGVPKSHVYHLVRSGQVRVNGGRVAVSHRLAIGDLLRIPPLRTAEPPPDPVASAEARLSLPILYEDDALLIVDKPAGIAVHGGSGESFGVIEALRRQRPQARFLELAHRLDRETSGILLLAKNRASLLALHEAFRQGEQQGGRVDKRYLVLVVGRWRKPTQEVRLPLQKYLLPSGERRVRVVADGKPAYTVFRLRARWQRFSLLEAELKTGRTHQLRVHLAHLGFPIAGDEKYGDFARNRELAAEGLKRMFLHAWKIRLPHPREAREVALEAALPDALARFLHTLARTGEQDYGETI